MGHRRLKRACYPHRVMRTFLALFSPFVITASIFAQQNPSAIEVPSTAKLLLQAKGVGDQVYACVDHKWTLKAPDAKIMDLQGTVIGKHFAGPTWQLTDDSEVKGKLLASEPSPDAASIPWLLLQAVPESGKGKFADVAYIRRTDTVGGASPKESCESGETRVPYTATYSFYGK